MRHPVRTPLVDIPQMADLTESMVGKSLNALASHRPPGKNVNNTVANIQ